MVGTSVDGHLMDGRLFDCRSVVVIYGHTADDTVVGLLGEYDHTHVYLLALVFGDSDGIACFGEDETCAVAILSHQHDVRLVDDDLLMIDTIHNKDLEGFSAFIGSLFDGFLDAFARTYHDVEILGINDRFSIHVDETSFVGALGGETDLHLVTLVVFVCPSLIKGIEFSRTCDIPTVAISTFGTNLIEVLARQAITIANVGFNIYEVVETAPKR